MGIADIMDPVYITVAPKTFVLKLCIGLITGLVAHRIARINESTDRKYVFKWSLIASIAGLAFNVVADPLVGFFYKQFILGQPQELAEALAETERHDYTVQRGDLHHSGSGCVQRGETGTDQKPSAG